MKQITLALIFGAVLLTGCSTAAPILTTTQTLDTRKQVNTRDMQSAIHQSLVRYGWKMDSDDGRTIMAHYNKQDRHIARIRIDYSAQQFSIRHESSEGLGYNSRRHTIHRNYNRWIQNLDNDIQSRLSFM